MSHPEPEGARPHDPPAPRPETDAPGLPGDYPDAAVPPPFPASPVPGDQQPVAHAGPYAGYGAPSAFAGPPEPHDAATHSSGPGGFAIAALIVGILAFISAWVPILGILVGIVGVVLGIMALRKGTGRGFAIAGIILSGLGLLAGIVMTILVFAVLPYALSGTTSP